MADIRDFVLTTSQSRTGQQPRQFAKDKDGGVYHMNRAGRWVKLDPAYAEHKQLHAEASAAIAKVEARIANYPQ